jgi:hypothetical protein
MLYDLSKNDGTHFWVININQAPEGKSTQCDSTEEDLKKTFP